MADMRFLALLFPSLLGKTTRSPYLLPFMLRGFAN
jgi:hypothetical protein